MTSEQYEEICRRFIAEKEGVPPGEIRSVRVPNPSRPGLPQYSHQIDLYWENGSDIAAYLNIANAKWRGTDKIDQGEVLLIQQVRAKVAAHKAFIITNVGFTGGAIAAAQDEGIALHVLEPNFDVSALPVEDRAAIQAKLAEIATSRGRPIWTHRVEHRGLGFSTTPHIVGDTPSAGIAARPGAYETRVVQPTHRTSVPTATRSHGGRETRGSSAQRDASSGHGGSRRG